MRKDTAESSIRKCPAKLNFIQSFLKEYEEILLVTTACSPMSDSGSFLTGWPVLHLKRFLLVFTNMRILYIPVLQNYSFRNSITQIRYGDCVSIALKGSALVIEYKNKRKEKFCFIGWGERNKLRSLLKTVSLTGHVSRTGGRVHLCPRCTSKLVRNAYTCPGCSLEFKTRAEGRKISYLRPGGGYFYTGHPWAGAAAAIIELLLMFFVIASLLDAFGGAEEGIISLGVFGLALVVEKELTACHTGKLIREYIPKEKEVKVMPAWQ